MKPRRPSIRDTKEEFFKEHPQKILYLLLQKFEMMEAIAESSHYKLVLILNESKRWYFMLRPLSTNKLFEGSIVWNVLDLIIL